MLWDVALRNLWQRRLRSSLTILGVAVMVQLNLMMAAMTTGFVRDLEQQLEALDGKVYVQQLTVDDVENEDFPSLDNRISAQVAADVLALEGVDQASSSAVIFVSLSPTMMIGKPPEVLAVGIEPGYEGAFLGDVQVEDGQLALAEPYSVILGQGAAQYYGSDGDAKPVKPGEAIEIGGQSFTVAGVLEPAPLLFNGAVLMPLTTAQELFGRPNTVSAVILTATRPQQVSTVQAAVAGRFPDLLALSQGDLAGRQDNQEQAIDFIRLIDSTVIAAVVVVVTIVMMMAVMEQRREIGTLRAIGARRSAILSLIVSGSLSLCFIGAVVALPLWIIVNELILTNVSASIAIMVSADVALSSWMGTVGMVLIAGVVAALWPAWQAVRVDPLEALRYD